MVKVKVIRVDVEEWWTRIKARITVKIKLIKLTF